MFRLFDGVCVCAGASGPAGDMFVRYKPLRSVDARTGYCNRGWKSGGGPHAALTDIIITLTAGVHRSDYCPSTATP